MRAATHNHEAQDLADQQQWMQLRKILLQMDRKHTRPKALKALKNMLVACRRSLAPTIWMSLATAYFYDHSYKHSIYYCQKTLGKYPLRPESIFCATLLIHLYKVLGMKKERYAAEGSRFQLMKKIIMQSENQEHRLFALQELRQEFADRDLLQDFYTFFNQTLRHNPHGKLLTDHSLSE